MRTWLLATAGVLALATAYPASAADLGMPMKAPVVAPAPVYNWTGFYIGGNVGGAWEHTDYNSSNATGVNDFTGSYDSNGWFGGGQIGLNYQFATHWVVGVEADADWADITGTSYGCTVTGCSSGNTKTDDFGTVRGRLGWAWNNVLLYGTGGWAWSHSSTDRTIVAAPFAPALVGAVATDAGSQSGWAAGAGIEWGFVPNWTLRVQYLHYEFDGIRRDFAYTGFPAAARHTNANTDTDTVSVGLNYLFNWGPAPVIARY